MSDVQPTSFLPPALVRASAYTPEQIARLGVPRGLVRFVPRVEATPQAAVAGRDPSPAAEIEAATRRAAVAESPATSTPNMGLGPRARFRFQAHDATVPTAPPSNLTSDPFFTRRAGAVRKLPKVSGLARWLSLGLVAIAAGAAGFFLARPISSEDEGGDAAARRSSDSRTWSPVDHRQLEAILAAESRRQTNETAALLNRLHATRPHLAGLPLLEARAAAPRSFADVESHLARAAEEPQADLAKVAFARAANYAAQRNLDAMRRYLDEAIALDPTRAEFHFQRAEVGRRQGWTQEALDDYDRALLLARSGLNPSRELIAFRRRLLLIERGREAELDAKAYQAAFAQPSPPADWILTAAAVALQRQDPETGARWLRSARAVMPWREYVERIDDFFFRNHIDEPGLKDLFPTDAERALFHASAPPVLRDP